VRELRLSLLSAPTSRAPLLPQDACATFCDETFDVIVYVAVQGLAKRGDEVALSWLKSRRTSDRLECVAPEEASDRQYREPAR
jgi:hypothetical protein